MRDHIVTVETNFGREVICTLLDIEDNDHHYRRTEIESYQVVSEWVSRMQKDFPHSKYHIYKLSESTKEG